VEDSSVRPPRRHALDSREADLAGGLRSVSTSAQMSACSHREGASASLPPHKSLLFNDFTAAVMDDELPMYRGRERPARTRHNSVRIEFNAREKETC